MCLGASIQIVVEFLVQTVLGFQRVLSWIGAKLKIRVLLLWFGMRVDAGPAVERPGGLLRRCGQGRLNSHGTFSVFEFYMARIGFDHVSSTMSDRA